MLNAIGVAVACEFSFLLGLVLGCTVVTLVPTTTGSWKPSMLKAIIEGVIIGLFAGTACLWVARLLGNWLAVPSSWWIWLAFALPVLGEFGHFLKRLSLRLRGTPNRGVFMPLGRVHAAAWEFLASGTFSELSFKLKRATEFTSASANNEVATPDSHEIGVLAFRETNLFIMRALWGAVLGAALVAWYMQGS